jgi:hypothetical protein
MCQNSLAHKLIKLGLRPSLVSAETGGQIRKLRALYSSVHGRAPRGIVRVHCDKKILSIPLHLEACIFYYIHRDLHGEKIFLPTLKADDIVCSYHAYSFISEPLLSFETAYLIAKDIQSGWIDINKCNRCSHCFLFKHDHPVMYRCPVCNFRKTKIRRAYFVS